MSNEEGKEIDYFYNTKDEREHTLAELRSEMMMLRAMVADLSKKFEDERQYRLRSDFENEQKAVFARQQLEKEFNTKMTIREDDLKFQHQSVENSLREEIQELKIELKKTQESDEKQLQELKNNWMI
ncbi:Oidioi.mRNA.OKI2018_I69.chr1.g1313.t1.cds [Oikopleura dioica]|uniref:Oidioi.mRNA.OKI2018_I69.chr1.g1313.t1.cds n=1 Tax=Oikopleura dioica TaxID=34765 RepID=A0ABN7SSR5_OIKDI|nr:Oidioi.mRNA.OKI2018_I69.chr1.g1313.t1.cds [Oikopleura dioica]